MPAIDRSLDAVAFVSEHFRDILRRRFSELAGLALITLALLGAIALATWSVQDPSLSHATQTPIHNLLGFPGAIFSDLAMQLLGLASILLLLPEALLGWRLLAHKPVGEKWRGLIWIAATLLAAGFASTLPRIGSWPLPTGLGGVAGDALLHVPALIFGAPLSGFTLIAISAVLAIATAATLVLAVGYRKPERKILVRLAEPEEIGEEHDAPEDRASAWLGMIEHALLAWKSRIGRALRRKPARAPVRAVSPVAATGRAEPRFDGHSRVAMPAPDDDDVEDEAQAAPRRRAPAKLAPRRTGSGFTLPSLNLLTAQRPPSARRCRR